MNSVNVRIRRMFNVSAALRCLSLQPVRGGSAHGCRRRIIFLALLAAVCLLTGCHGMSSAIRIQDTDAKQSSLSVNANWYLGEFGNASNRATAPQALMTLLETHLRYSGVQSIVSASASAHYRIQGSIEQWMYLNGASSRPAISLSIAVYDAQSGVLLWAAETEKLGSRRESLTLLADRMLADLVQQMPIDQSDSPVSTNGVMAEADYLKFISPQPSAASSQAAALAGPLGSRVNWPWNAEHSAMTEHSLQGRSVAFYYGADPDVSILSQFDRLVLEPDNLQSEQLQQLRAQGASTFAYLSVGEVGPTRGYADQIEDEWLLGSNDVWNSKVLDLSSMDLRALLLSRVGQLQQAGYDGVFLDTMDSYHLYAKTPGEKQAQQAGIVSFIKSMAIRYPSMRVIVNRGFEVLDEIAAYVEAVAAESLYQSWNNEDQQYQPVTNNDRAWLTGKLVHARDVLGLDVIAIDYVPPENRDLARTVASDIVKDGFIPWVATPSLDYIGVGALEVIPRKVLMLYDSEVDGPIEVTSVHQLLAMPVEYLGYVPEYLDIRTESLPAGELKGRYAGIVTWASETYQRPQLRPWLKQQMKARVPVAFFSIPPVEPDVDMLSAMGIRQTKPLDERTSRVTLMDNLFSPERSLPKRYMGFGFLGQSTSAGNTVHLRFTDAAGRQTDPVVTGEFGGFAWQPGITMNGLDYVLYWMIDPFQFIRAALQLPDIPQPDVTTENGKRLWLAHIDGDALPSWAQMPGRQLGAEVIYDQILQRYPLPHTVSVVEGEMTAFPMFDDRLERMYDIARKTFALDHVRLASHTYSHPFKWAQIRREYAPGRLNLRIGGYRFNSERELAGSIDFIDRELAPAGKKTELLLWSGDALPQLEDLQVLDRIGIANLNGGTTSISRHHPSFSRVSPMARPVGDLLQVYAPIMNENVYTNDWQGPYDGFRDVIGTLQMTDFPRRIKPINVYYHFYSGTKTASLRALEDVYAWSTTQDIHPIHVIDYARKVPDFRKAGVARYLDGHWKLSRLGSVRSLRLLSGEQWPDLSASQGITGARRLHDGMYLHTDGRSTVSLKTTNKTPSLAFLVSSNGRVESWRQNDRSLIFQISAEVPVVVELGGITASACQIRVGDELFKGVATESDTVVFSFSRKNTGSAYLSCQT